MFSAYYQDKLISKNTSPLNLIKSLLLIIVKPEDNICIFYSGIKVFSTKYYSNLIKWAKLEERILFLKEIKHSNSFVENDETEFYL